MAKLQMPVWDQAHARVAMVRATPERLVTSRREMALKRNLENTRFRLMITLERGARHDWCRLEVEALMPLTKLAPVVLAAMGWPSDASYAFAVDGCLAPGGRARLADIFVANVEHFSFLCDQQGWCEHAVFIEEVGSSDPALCYPRLIDGGNSIP